MSDKVTAQSILKDSLEKKSQNLAYNVTELNDCSLEPIAFCGAIQPFGLLIVFNFSNHLIEAVSANFYPAETLLGESIYTVLKSNAVSPNGDIKEFCSSISSEKIIFLLKDPTLSEYRVTNCYHHSGSVYCEFEKLTSYESDRSVTLIKDLVVNLRENTGLEASCEKVANAALDFSDFDRVMI
ncbi:MAG: hypothetical protein H7235_11145, partial [Bdellovibrionaceae bacterium]|nr:hypothetical protein [Pseudobdellovibrionaceae bacterium]